MTDNMPKPMVPLCGRPILAHQVEWLKEGGVSDVMFLAGYRWEAIQDYFGDGRPFGIRAHYSVEDSPLGRGGAIRKGFALLPAGEESVVVLNGDVITREKLDAVIDRHRQRKDADPSHLATIMVVPMISPYGLVEVGPGDAVLGFQEKVEMPYWINAGVYLFDRGIAEEMPELGDHEISTFPRLARAGRISAHKSRAFWRSVDSLKDLREAEEYLSGH